VNERKEDFLQHDATCKLYLPAAGVRSAVQRRMEHQGFYEERTLTNQALSRLMVFSTSLNHKSPHYALFSFQTLQLPNLASENRQKLHSCPKCPPRLISLLSISCFFSAAGMTVLYWDFMGSTMVTNNYIRLTPDLQSKEGAIWNTVVSA
jgi:Legume-like lectin family